MILFRRVGEAFKHIEDREWMLLALETLGVLAGILIAFELQLWGQHRSEAARHHQLMVRLFEETESDVASIRFMRDVLKPKISREQLFAAEIGRGECPPDVEFQALVTLGMLPALTPPASAYQELLGGGGLSSIDRDDVRTALARFHETVEFSQKQIDYFRMEKRDAVQDSDKRTQIRFDPAAEEPEIVTFDRPALCQDQGFRNLVASQTRQHTVFLRFLQNPLEEAINLCVRLGDSLGRKCTPPYGGPLTGADDKVAATAASNMIKERAKRQRAKAVTGSRS